MRIGYLVSLRDENDAQRLLSESGVDETVADLSRERRQRLGRTIEKLRPGDVLVVPNLWHVSPSMLGLIKSLDAVHRAGAGLHVVSEGWLAANSDLSFAGRLMAFERERRSERRAFAKAGTRRGLSDAQIAEAVRMIEEGSLTLAEVADKIGCSVPTLHRARRRVEARGKKQA
jgi:Resolvase, N terminal domain